MDRPDTRGQRNVVRAGGAAARVLLVVGEKAIRFEIFKFDLNHKSVQVNIWN